MASLGTCLWFDDQAAEAAAFYTSIFPNSRIVGRADFAAETPSEKEVGSEMTVDFELDGRPFTALNGGPHFTFNEAVSIVVNTEGQEETDHYWQALLDGGGEPAQCGWLTDRFGLSWQVVPKELGELLADPDPERARRATEAMLAQSRIVLEEIRAAVEAAA